MPGLKRAVFLDRDGVINGDSPDYIKSLDEFAFLPRSLEALKRLARLDAEIIVVTNQSQIGRGVTPAEVIHGMNRWMVEQIEAEGGRITDVFVCPHAPEEQCGCRKPQPGLLLMAAEKHGIDLGRSIMVGDRPSDLAAAQAAGCAFVRVCPDEAPELSPGGEEPVSVRDLYEAVEYIETRFDAA